MISLRSRITRAVLNYFMVQDGAEAYINELARRFSLDSGNLTRKLIELEQEGILKSRQQGGERFFSLNKAFPLLAEYKKIILKTAGLEHLLREALKDIPGLKKAVLFGSYAEDRMHAASDIDLLLVGEHRLADAQKAIAGIQKTTDREINAVNLSEAEYRSRVKRKDPFLRSIETKKSIVLI